jgi:hypothetical protein
MSVMDDTPDSPLQLKRRHAAGLVLAVLVVHVWLLAASPAWLAPGMDTRVHTVTFTTRQIELASPRAPQVPQTPHTQAEVNTAAQPVVTPTAPPTTTAPHRLATHQEIEDLSAQLTAPVALPARSASGVDLPPFNRAASPTTHAVVSAAEVTAFKPPPAARMKYDVNGKTRHLNYSAWAELLWQQDSHRYDARLEVGAFLLGSRVQTSSGLLGSEGLMPLRFGDKSRSELAAHFQRDKNIISFSANTPDVTLLKGAQDRLSVVLQLSALLAADPTRYPTGTMLSFQTVSQREAEVWQFVVDKEELVSLPYGDLPTLKLSRNPRREFDQRIELWFAPGLDYLPVRLRITNANGDSVDQLLRSLEKPGS